MVQLEKVNL